MDKTVSEKIIISNVLNQNEFCRTISKKDINSIGLKVLNSLDLARYVLQKSNVVITENFLPNNEASFIIYQLMHQVDYFKDASFSDAKNLNRAFVTLQKFAQSNKVDSIKKALSNAEFSDKNNAIYQVFNLYKQHLKDHLLMDSQDVICKAVEFCNIDNLEIIQFEEHDLSPLEENLAFVASGGKVKKMSVLDFCNLQTDNTPDIKYYGAYGSINEAEYIISKIYEAGIPLDECLIACTDVRQYSQIFYDIAKQNNINMTFGSGITIANSNAVALLKLLCVFEDTTFKGIDSLINILTSDSFDIEKLKSLFNIDEISNYEISDFANMAGSLRISSCAYHNQKHINAYRDLLESKISNLQTKPNIKEFNKINNKMKLLSWTQAFATELESGYSYFIKTYTKLRDAEMQILDTAAVEAVCDTIDLFEYYKLNLDLKDIYNEVMQKRLMCSLSAQGAVHVCGLNQAFNSMRKHVFVCGLQANIFPGSSKEDYLLLDNDLANISNSKVLPTSSYKIYNQINNFNNFIKFANAWQSKIALSYTSFNLVELKEQNASSVLYALYKTYNKNARLEDFTKQIKDIEYFESCLNKTSIVAKELFTNQKLNYQSCYPDMPKGNNLLDIYWSPSALEQYFSCPKRFYLTRVLKLEDLEVDDPFVVISAADLGTMAHKMMELLPGSNFTKDQFMQICENAFDEFLIARPPVFEENAKTEKQQFLDMMEAAYKFDPKNKIVSAETEYRYVHKSGIKLHGFPDRIEVLENGKCAVVDFKTKRKVDHEPNDIETCLQVVVYAWLCEQAGIDVEKCEYRYLRKSLAIECQYDQHIKDQLDEKINQFKQALEQCCFPSNPGKDSCKYCGMKAICNWPQESKEE